MKHLQFLTKFVCTLECAFNYINRITSGFRLAEHLQVRTKSISDGPNLSYLILILQNYGNWSNQN